MKPFSRLAVIIQVLTLSFSLAQAQTQPDPDEVPLCTDPVATANCLEDEQDPYNVDSPKPSDTDPYLESEQDSDDQEAEESESRE